MKSMTIPREQVMDKVVALTKRRGFIFSSPFMGKYPAQPGDGAE